MLGLSYLMMYIVFVFVLHFVSFQSFKQAVIYNYITHFNLMNTIMTMTTKITPPPAPARRGMLFVNQF